MQTGCFPVSHIQCIINDVKVKEKFLVLKFLDVGNTHSDILDLLNTFFNMLQNHSSVKLFTLCIHEYLMNIYTKFYPRTVSQS